MGVSKLAAVQWVGTVGCCRTLWLPAVELCHRTNCAGLMNERGTANRLAALAHRRDISISLYQQRNSIGNEGYISRSEENGSKKRDGLLLSRSWMNVLLLSKLIVAAFGISNFPAELTKSGLVTPRTQVLVINI